MQDKSETFDVIVAGGGPGGASAAALLARHGKRVLLLERETVPRFHIGESLLPAAWELWEKIGVREALEAARFTVKQGVMFGMFGAAEDVTLLTAEFPEFFPRPWTYHVERAEFDQILLDNARKQGATVRTGWSVKELVLEGERAVGVLAGPNGEAPREIRARVVVDATGRDCLLARKMGWRKPDPALNKVAHFTHFEGGYRRNAKDVVRDLAPVLPTSSATDIHTIEGGWIWYIPLKNDIVSVGAVLDTRYAGGLPGTPQEKFDAAIASNARMAQWLKGAEQKMPVQTIASISYLNDRFVGDGFMLVGDAAMFVDPIFSAGVTLATRAGVFAGEQILESFEKNDFSAQALAPYEARIRKPMEAIFKMIYNWYQILERKDANNLITLSRRAPLLRERLIVLLSGGYDKMDLERIRAAAPEAA